VFTVAGRQLAADIRHTREVVALPDRTPVPRAPAHVLGVANLRGYIVPIVDIRHLLGSPAGPPSEAARTPRTIVLEGDGAQIAIAMDEVLGLESFDEVLPGPPAASSTPGAPRSMPRTGRSASRPSGCSSGVTRRRRCSTCLHWSRRSA
jgi:chemotaxis signal transduction protein